MHLESNAVLRKIEHVAESEGFPIVGPNVGTWLRQFARLTGAKRVFEFGSGYGCSACWFGQALPEDGQMVLTDVNETTSTVRRRFSRMPASTAL